MYYPCNATINSHKICGDDNHINPSMMEEDWPLERVVSMVVPVFFGLIGLAGLLGNALVVVGKFKILLNLFA